MATSTATFTPSSVGATSSGPNIGAIVGGVIGGVAAIVIVIVALLLWRKRKARCHVAPSAAYMAECGCRALPCPTPQPPSRHYSYTSVAAEKDAVGRHFVRVASASSFEVFSDLPNYRRTRPRHLTISKSSYHHSGRMLLITAIPLRGASRVWSILINHLPVVAHTSYR